MRFFGARNTAPRNNNSNGIFHNEPRRVSTQSGPCRNDECVESKHHHSVAYGQEHRHDSVVTGRSYLKHPNCGDWIKHNWLDVCTLAAFGALALGVS